MSYSGTRYARRSGGSRQRGSWGGGASQSNARRFEVSAARWNDDASPAQIGKLKGLLTERQLFDDPYDRAWALIAAHELYVDGKPGGTRMVKGPTSKVISWVLENTEEPAAVGTTLGQRTNRLADLGVYVRDGQIFVVREWTPPGEDKPVRYCKQVIPSTEPHVNEAGDEEWHFEEIAARGMQWQLTAAEAMPQADYEAFCQKYKHCLACHRRLTKPESIKRGKGKVCWDRQMALESRRLAEAS